MLKNLVPLTKLFGTIAFSFWALVFNTPAPLLGLVVVEVMLLAACGNLRRNLKAFFSLCVFSVFSVSYSSSAAAASNRHILRACACFP